MSNLEQLKTLLLEPEQSHIDDLEKRVCELEQHAREFASQLPEAIQSISAEPRFLASLDKPISDTITQTIRRDVNSFAEVLFPVMGPAIRRAVADAMKSLVERINLALEQNLSIQSIKWRLIAARTGVPLAQIIIDKTMLFSVQEVFLIDPASGLVIGRAVRNPVLSLDEDAVSSMLIAIQSFVTDSFGGNENDVLRSVEVGDQTLWMIGGPDAILACIIAGTPARDLRDTLRSRLESIHFHHAKNFSRILQSKSESPSINAELQTCLLEQSQDLHKSDKKPWIFAGLFSLALLAIILVSMNRANTRAQTLSNINALLGQHAGIIIHHSEWQSDKLVVTGLRDPVADDPQEVLDKAGLTLPVVEFNLQPYYALEPLLIIRRLRRQLSLPAELELVLAGDVLTVASTVTSIEMHTIRDALLNHPLINRVEFDLPPPRSLEQRIIEFIGAQEGLEVLITNQEIALHGLAPIAWIKQSRVRHLKFEQRSIDWSQLWPVELQTVESLAVEIKQQSIQFVSALKIQDNSLQVLPDIAAKLSKLNAMALDQGIIVNTQVIGFTDGVGDLADNEKLRLQRAKKIYEQLLVLGVAPDNLSFVAGEMILAEGELNLQYRRVNFDISY